MLVLHINSVLKIALMFVKSGITLIHPAHGQNLHDSVIDPNVFHALYLHTTI